MCAHTGLGFSELLKFVVCFLSLEKILSNYLFKYIYIPISFVFSIFSFWVSSDPYVGPQFLEALFVFCLSLLFPHCYHLNNLYWLIFKIYFLMCVLSSPSPSKKFFISDILCLMPSLVLHFSAEFPHLFTHIIHIFHQIL